MIYVLTAHSIPVIVVNILDLPIPKGQLPHPIHTPTDPATNGKATWSEGGSWRGTTQSCVGNATCIHLESISAEVVPIEILTIVIRGHIINMNLITELKQRQVPMVKIVSGTSLRMTQLILQTLNSLLSH